MTESLENWLESSVAWAENAMRAAMDPMELGPKSFAEALRYPTFAGGKRLRPCLVRLINHEMGGRDADAESPAVAIEWVHTYSLVHDDLPCMDDDDLRRGKPTTHKVYGEATAVLVGDGLLTLAFELLANRGGPNALDMIAVLARAAGPAGMVGGQHLDLSAEQGGVNTDGVREIHRLKTAALIEAACELGALAAGASAAARQAARRYGLALGLCFQAVDDCLDVTGQATDLGKTPGKDAAAGKATLVADLGLDGAQEEAGLRAAEARVAAQEAGFQPQGFALGLVDWLLSRTH
ncbi:MAG: polyprenyl synthetase family protein [Planctomycetes bacterium]|nr:polyprenyl synthetase family protein [Planctomycetota bacterium]